MLTFDTYYTDKIILENFIHDNAILDSKNILLQIFTGICDENYINNLVSEIKEFLPNIKIIGSTTDGEIINGMVSSNSTILSFSIFEKTKIDIHRVPLNSSSYAMGEALIDTFEDQKETNLAIIFTDGLHTNGELFLNAFNDKTSHITVSGGLSSDNAEFIKTYIFTQDGFCNDGAVCAVFYNKDLIINTSFGFGWEAISKEFIVTKAIENRVYMIDNITPVELYKKYLGDKVGDRLPATGIEFPLIIKRNGRNIARAVTSKENDGSLVFAGNIKDGDIISIGYGNVEKIISNIHHVYNDIINQPSEAIFIYSCMARKRLLGKDIINELSLLNNITDTSGFFTYGEFFHCDKSKECQNQLLNQTITVLSLSEDINKQITSKKLNTELNTDSLQTVEALSHLINETNRELKELNTRLHELATTDKLTNINNRYSVMKKLEEEIVRANRYSVPLSLIMFDIDHFKVVNDTYGHDIGDDVLISLSNLINENLREVDIFGRYGGEEFLIVLPSTMLNKASIYAQRIRKKVDEYNFNIVNHITISIGLVELKSNETIDNIIKRADILLYKSKENGRNIVSQ